MNTPNENLALAKELKQLVEQIREYEHTLYEILDCKLVKEIHVMAAEALGEDLEIYNEKDVVDIFEEPENDLDYAYDEETE
jgi:hypothetical protein